MFSLVSAWRIEATAAQVWSVMSDVESWPAWWPGIARAQVIRPGDDGGAGQRVHLSVRSPWGYGLRFTVETLLTRPPYLATARVVGDLSGTGRWRIWSSEGFALARIDWNVNVQRPWLALAARPLARPLVWAHGRVMASGERALSERVATRARAAGAGLR